MGILIHWTYKAARLLKGLSLCVLLGMALSPGAQAVTVQLPEHKIKAGLVYNFIKYTQWPQGTFKNEDSLLNLCLLGGDSFGGALDPLNGRTAQMHRILVREISTLDHLTTCHAVYIHESQAKNLDEIVATAAAHPILLLSDIADFSAHHGMVELTTSDKKRIRLLINHENIARSGLTVGETLLKLAENR